MILSPNEIPNCVLWLDASDLNTMFQQLSVETRNITSVQNMIRYSDLIFHNYYVTSDFSHNQIQTGVTEVNSTMLPNGLSGHSIILQENATNSSHSVGNWDSRYLLPVGTYTFSFHVRPISTNRLLQVGIVGSSGGDAVLTFNPTTRVVFGTPTASVISYTIDTPGIGGWYRVSLTFNTVIDTPIYTYFALLLTTGASTYTGNYESVNLWGAQLESGSTATVYKPTQDVPLITPSYNALITPPPHTRVTQGTQNVRYWKNKSLSAEFYGLSGAGAHPRNYNNWFYQSRLQPWFQQLSGITFRDGPFLTAYSEIPIPVEEETVFFIGTGDHEDQRDAAWYQTLITQASSTHPLSLYTLHTNTLSVAPFAHFIPLLTHSVFDGGTTDLWVGPGVSYSLVNPYQPGPFNYHGHLDWYYHVGETRSGVSPTTTGGWWRSGTTSPFTFAVCKSGNIIENFYNGMPVETWNPIMSGGHLDRRTNTVGPANRTSHRTFPAVDLFRFGADYCPNMSLHGDQSRRSGNWSQSFYRAFPWTYQRWESNRTCEVIIYNRRLTQQEVEDVTYYLLRKWPHPFIKRPVYALSGGSLSNSLIVSVSGEPAPWNTILSSDRIFTNNFILTADTNLRCDSITNGRCINSIPGGFVVLTESAILTANIIGGANNFSGPSTPGWALYVPPGSCVSLQGNIYGGGTTPFNSEASLEWGGLIPASSTLNLSGSVFGGWSFGSYGVYTSGGIINLSPGNSIKGGGGVWNQRWDYPYSNITNSHPAGLSAINTTLNFNNIELVGGNLAPGVWCVGSNVTLTNCRLYNGYPHSGKSNWSYAGRHFRAPWVFTTPIYAVSSNVKAFNTIFSSTTGSQSTSLHWPGTDMGSMFLDCRNYFENCHVRVWHNNSRLDQDITDSRLATERHSLVDLQNNPEFIWQRNGDIGGSGLFFRNCQVSGNNITIRTGSTTDTTSTRSGDAVVMFSNNTVAYLNNTQINPGGETGNMGVVVAGNSTLYLSGSVTGSGKGYNGEGYGIHNKRGFVFIQGRISANPAGGVGLYNANRGTAVIRGVVTPSYTSSGIYSFSPLSAFYSEPFISSVRGFAPITARICQYFPLCSLSLFTTFANNDRGKFVTYRDSNYVLDYPLSSNVLKDVSYGTIGYEQTGTSIIPEPSAVIIGVPVRATYGTALPLTVDAFWNQPITNVVQNNTNAFTKLITPLTVQALSAIVPSLDYPVPTS